jgi:hypothetical protein
MIYRENDPVPLSTLSRALHAKSPATRVRAVAMLACADCSRRMEWLEVAASDECPAVRETACAVLAWVAPPPHPAWPAREDLIEVPARHADEVEDALLGEGRHQWEYVVEVWRENALLEGVFVVSTCEEDDAHAKRIALGQAILASAQPGRDAFEPRSAASFIVSKRRIVRRPSQGAGRDAGAG